MRFDLLKVKSRPLILGKVDNIARDHALIERGTGGITTKKLTNNNFNKDGSGTNLKRMESYLAWNHIIKDILPKKCNKINAPSDTKLTRGRVEL